MSVWLGRSPAGNGWRYMHEDGRVEDAPDETFPPGFVPPGFEGEVGPAGGTPSYADATYGSPEAPPAPVDLSPAETPAPTPVEPAVAPAAQPSQPAPGTSIGASASWRGATAPVTGSSAATRSVDGKAHAEAARQTALLAGPAAAQQNAVLGIANAQAGQSDATAQGFRDEGALLRTQQEDRLREVAHVNEAAARWTADIREAVDSVPTMSANRVFANQSNREQIGTAVAAFMGGFLQPVLGTNTPMDIINKAVDRDIAEQQNAQEMAQRKVWNMKDLAKMDTEQLVWNLGQKDIARAGMLTALQRDVQAKVQSYQSDVFKKQGQKLLADIDKELTTTYINLNNTLRQGYEQQRHNIRMESIQSQELALRKAAAAAASGGSAQDLEKRAIRDPATGKVVGYLKTGTDAQAHEYNTKQASAFNTSRNLLKLNKLVTDNGKLWKKSNWGSTPEAAELRGVYNDLLADIIKSKTGAAASAPELERLEKVLPFPSKFSPDMFRNIENYVDKVTDEQNATNSASLAPLEGEETLGYNFADSVKRLRGEYAANDPKVPVASMNEGMLMLEAAGNDPQKVRTTVRKIVDAALASSEIDSGRAGIDTAIAALSKLPVELRSMPHVDGDIDPVELLQTIKLNGQIDEGVKLSNTAVEADQATAQQSLLENVPMGYGR